MFNHYNALNNIKPSINTNIKKLSRKTATKKSKKPKSLLATHNTESLYVQAQ